MLILRGIILLAVFVTVDLNFSGRVIAVLDGDTIEVFTDGKPVRVRLAGVDCPEKRQAFGIKAKEFTALNVAGKEVFIKYHGIDRYERVIGDVFLITGKDSLRFNKALVEAGLAWHYKRYSDDLHLAVAEINAKKGKLGLWTDVDPVPPWEFRKFSKK